ncbi:hypothetical protein KI387_031757, partial [Taxus chinensis]
IFDSVVYAFSISLTRSILRLICLVDESSYSWLRIASHSPTLVSYRALIKSNFNFLRTSADFCNGGCHVSLYDQGIVATGYLVAHKWWMPMWWIYNNNLSSRYMYEYWDRDPAFYPMDPFHDKPSKHLVVFTGAGISTSCGIPDFRGPTGIWTLQRQGKPLPKADMPFHRAMPGLTHMALAELEKALIMKFVISQ